MKKGTWKRYSLFLIVLIVLVLTGCQRVDEARTQFCGTVEEIGTLATEFKSAKVDDPVDEFQGKVETLQERKQRLDRLANIAPGPVLERLSTATDNVAAAVNTVSGSTLGPAVDKIQAAGAELQAAYQGLDEAVCGEK